MERDLPFSHQKQKPLSEFSTFKIGGPARYFAEAANVQEMREMLTYAYSASIPVHILGKGSNSLFDDRGFNGLVILNRIDFLEQKGEVISVGSGYSFARLGNVTARGGWSGLEFASGIPGTVGGAVYMNAGANGKETADVLREVGYVTKRGELIRFKREELDFSYRCSSFQKWRESIQGAIVDAIIYLTPSESAKPTQREILDYRLKTQPYGDKSAGCAFRNPEGESAGALIEAMGFKGMCHGGATVSERHANFIVNTGKAKAVDVLALIEEIKEKVYRERGILLEEEIRYIPYDIQS
ncbi:MAG: UDP-N-acetylmuramate dehydrogenase [Chlamydiales bacterium]|nr:UDP-N-acetylmuramate dehydrogenase [Chlamydiales bacterium]